MVYQQNFWLIHSQCPSHTIKLVSLVLFCRLVNQIKSLHFLLGCSDPPQYINAQCGPATGPYPVGSTVTCNCTYIPNCEQGQDNCYQCVREQGRGLTIRCTETLSWKQVQPFPNQDPPQPPLLPIEPYCDNCRQGQSEYYNIQTLAKGTQL